MRLSDKMILWLILFVIEVEKSESLICKIH